MTAPLENDRRHWWERIPQDQDRDGALAISSVLADWRRTSMPGRPLPGRSRLGESALGESVPRGQGARVAVVCDASESMRDFSGVMASLAWALITGIHHDASTPVRSVVLRAGRDDVERIGGIDHQPGLIGPRICPWNRPVSEPGAGDLKAHLDWAVEAADEFVDLHTDGPARLLVLITDDRQNVYITDRTCDYLDHLQRQGCQVLWICPSTSPVISWTFPRAHLHLINPRDFAGPDSVMRARSALYCLGGSVLDALTASQENQNV